MPTANSNVTAGDFISATRKYSNKDNAERIFNINADVEIKNNQVITINKGSVTKATEATNGNATFSKGENWISFNANNLSSEEQKEAFEAILGFIADVEENVKTINEE